MNPINTTTRRRLGALAGSLALVVTLGACGSDGEDADASSPTAVAAGATTTAPAVTGDDDHGDHDGLAVTVGAVDFAFQDLPSTLAAGTRLSLVNHAETELHELVAFRLPDDDDRSARELMALDQAALGAVLGGPPTTVILAPPKGAPAIEAVGDGTLQEPGRYLVFCSIPTGVDPDVYLAAAAAAGGEQPQVEGGPPHFVEGMFAEVVVE